MPSNVMRTFSIQAVPDAILNAVVAAIESGVKKANKNGNIQRLELTKKGYRQDLVFGELFVVPASVCASAKDFPIMLLKSSLIHGLTAEESVEFKFASQDGSATIHAEVLKRAKELFKNKAGKETCLLAFAPTWADAGSFRTFPYEPETVTAVLQNLVFAAPVNPALSSVFDQIKARDEDFPLKVVNVPQEQHIFNFASENNDRPELAKGDEETKKKKASIELRPKLRLTIVAAADAKADLVSKEERELLDALDASIAKGVKGMNTMPEKKAASEVTHALDHLVVAVAPGQVDPNTGHVVPPPAPEPGAPTNAPAPKPSVPTNAIAQPEQPEEEKTSGAKWTMKRMEEFLHQKNQQDGTDFSVGGAYGNYELWANGEERLEAGSLQDVYNTWVKYRFSPKYKKKQAAAGRYEIIIGADIIANIEPLGGKEAASKTAGNQVYIGYWSGSTKNHIRLNYVHWKPKYSLLVKTYGTDALAKELIELGDLSSVEQTMDETYMESYAVTHHENKRHACWPSLDIQNGVNSTPVPIFAVWVKSENKWMTHPEMEMFIEDGGVDAKEQAKEEEVQFHEASDDEGDGGLSALTSLVPVAVEALPALLASKEAAEVDPIISAVAVEASADEDEEEEEDEEEKGPFYYRISEFGAEVIIKIQMSEGKWRESVYDTIKGNAGDLQVGGSTYMSYLTQDDLTSWLRRDYDKVEFLGTEAPAKRKRKASEDDSDTSSLLASLYENITK